MGLSEINTQVYRCSYLASEFLHRHRTVIILGAFVFWTATLAKGGYFREFDGTNTWPLIFGFLWLTIPMSFATYFLPRVLLKIMPLMNGYRHDEREEKRS